MNSYNLPSTSGHPHNPGRSYYNARSHETDPRRPPHRALTNPERTSHPRQSTPPQHQIPSSLKPGSRSIGQPAGETGPQLLFQNPFQDNAEHPIQAQMKSHLPYKLHHTQSVPPLPPPPVPPKNMHRSLTSPLPPLPPKPTLAPSRAPPYGLPTLPPKIPLYPRSVSEIPPSPPFHRRPTEKPLPGTEDDELATALALSASESGDREKLLSQEKEDLSRALEESMISQAYERDFYRNSRSEMEVTSKENSGTQTTASNPLVSASGIVSRSVSSGGTGTVTNPELRRHRSLTSADQPSQAACQQMLDDMAYARRLAEADGPSPLAITDRQVVERPLSTNVLSNTTKVCMPATSNIEGTKPIPLGHSAPPDRTSLRTNFSRSLPSTLTGEADGSSVHLPSTAASPSARPALLEEATSLSGRATVAEGMHPDLPTILGKPAFSQPPSMVLTSSTVPIGQKKQSPSLSANEHPTQADTSGVTANQFVEDELLRGVSLGFMPPSISTALTVMPSPVPSVITLPFGKCPPLHIKTTTWRHLLKLMARLSGTRIEPTVEAVAEAKGDLQLRTVIQFAKVHHSSTEWRTIIWLTIEHPIPPSTINAGKYTNGDVNTLPWSYTLSNPPALLCDGADSPVSKVYSIPSTPLTPYPTLPITFPNMALYLQSVLEESRKAINDSSSGLRKLAKMVETYYPSEPESESVGGQETLERSTMGGLLKRVIKRSKPNTSRGRGGNDDTYELVTPFVPDA